MEEEKTSALKILETLSKYRFHSLDNEKRLQTEILKVLKHSGFAAIPEFSLSKKDRIDFFVDGVGIEVKVKGSPIDVFKQVERYATFDSVTSLLLVTTKVHGFPSEMNGKPVYVLRLGSAWL